MDAARQIERVTKTLLEWIFIAMIQRRVQRQFENWQHRREPARANGNTIGNAEIIQPDSAIGAIRGDEHRREALHEKRTGVPDVANERLQLRGVDLVQNEVVIESEGSWDVS